MHRLEVFCQLEVPVVLLRTVLARERPGVEMSPLVVESVAVCHEPVVAELACE